MELVSIQNRYGHGISFSQLAIVRVRESIRWALIRNYVYLQLNCDSAPWGFAYDNVNYACYLPAFFSEMSLIEETHQEAYEAEYLKFGGFKVKIGDQNPLC